MITRPVTGAIYISQAFNQARNQGRAALMPYFTLGYPDAERSLDIIQAIAQSGADLIELGMPFSDPLADGPTIQRSTQQALAQGMTVRRCLDLTADLRKRGVKQPLLLMGYLNPILSYGEEMFASDAAASGADGLIIPDLPPEEAGMLEGHCQNAGLAQIYLLAPASTVERIQLAAGRSSGFIYLVSVTGVTGERTTLPDDLMQFIRRVREATDKPLAVGFGISTPEQVAQIGRLADGVIVGSALINAAASGMDPVRGATEFIANLRAGLERN